MPVVQRAEVGKFYRVDHFHRNGSQVGIVTRHVLCTFISAAGTKLQDIADAMQLDWQVWFQDWASGDTDYRGCLLYEVGIGPGPFPVPILGLSGGFVGQAATPTLPRQVSGLITLRTDRRGAKYRGRAYPPFPSGDMYNTPAGGVAPGGIVQLDFLALLLSSGVTYTQGADQARIEPVIYHRAEGTGDYVTSTIVRDAWATQKRRGDFGRTNLSPI